MRLGRCSDELELGVSRVGARPGADFEDPAGGGQLGPRNERLQHLRMTLAVASVGAGKLVVGDACHEIRG
jgi:hypothetical protein